VVTAPVIGEYLIACGVFTAGLDNGDFPSLGLHNGSPMLHDARRLFEVNDGTPVAQMLQPLGQEGGGMVRIDTRSKRKLERTDDRLFMVLEKDRNTEEDVLFRSTVTVMWLLP